MTTVASLKPQTINTSSIFTQRQLRIEKLEALQRLGINAYPVESHRDFTLAQAKLSFENIRNTQSEITLAGRIKSKRGSGKIGFVTLEDESLPEGFQLVLKVDELPQPANLEQELLDKDNQLTYKAFRALIEEGDYIQATGYLDTTVAGENSLFVTSFKLLTKALRPLPDTMDYTNVESRYMDRVADYKMNTKDEFGLSVRDVIRAKSKYWQIWREECYKEGMLEVDIPVFELIPGGAEAKPFTTFYNELNQDVYLRLSLELPQKKLIAGGFESIFVVGPVFRNEGSSPQHLQEYTQIEWYKAYTDYNYAATFTKRVYQRVVKEVLGSMEQKDYYGNQINWGNWCTQEFADKNGWGLESGWPKINYFDAVRYFSNGQIDTENKSDQELLEMCQLIGINDVKISDGTATMLDKLWKKARVNTVNPFFLINPPVELEPLAKRDPNNPKLTQRWQIVAGRAELGKAFSELNDPIDQFGRFEIQQEAKDAGNEEAQSMDLDYVKAMEYGMPPMSGFGTSERFVSFLLGKHIKECTTFPHVRKEISKEERTNILQEKKSEIERELDKLGLKKDTLLPSENLNVDNLHAIDPGEIVNHFGNNTIPEYWNDSYKYKSTAKFIDFGVDDIGHYCFLDKTIFYPQGGGQPGDTGIIKLDDTNYFKVAKCLKHEGIVRHYGEIVGFISTNQEVTLEIDKEKRLENINLHSAAHLIDYALNNLGVKSVGGKGYSFPAGPYCEYNLTDASLESNLEFQEQLEKEVNRLRLLNLEFTPTYKKEKNGDIIRTIEIDGGKSTCPCAGTHVKNTREFTGEIIIRETKIKKGVLKVKYSVIR